MHTFTDWQTGSVFVVLSSARQGHFASRAMVAILRAAAAAAVRGDRHAHVTHRGTRRSPAARNTRRRASVSASSAPDEGKRVVSRKASVPVAAFASLVTTASPARAEGLEVWRYPDGSNPLEALFSGPSPIPLVTGELTGVWFGDVFAYANLVLLLALVVFSSTSPGEETDGSE